MRRPAEKLKLPETAVDQASTTENVARLGTSKPGPLGGGIDGEWLVAARKATLATVNVPNMT